MKLISLKKTASLNQAGMHMTCQMYSNVSTSFHIYKVLTQQRPGFLPLGHTAPCTRAGLHRLQGFWTPLRPQEMRFVMGQLHQNGRSIGQTCFCIDNGNTDTSLPYTLYTTISAVCSLYAVSVCIGILPTVR